MFIGTIVLDINLYRIDANMACHVVDICLTKLSGEEFMSSLEIASRYQKTNFIDRRPTLKTLPEDLQLEIFSYLKQAESGLRISKELSRIRRQSDIEKINGFIGGVLQNLNEDQFLAQRASLAQIRDAFLNIPEDQPLRQHRSINSLRDKIVHVLSSFSKGSCTLPVGGL